MVHIHHHHHLTRPCNDSIHVTAR